MILTRATHERVLREIHEDYAQTIVKMADKHSDTVRALFNELTEVRRTNLKLENDLAEARGRLIAQAHEHGEPAPHG